jgi:hypothetical protein
MMLFSPLIVISLTNPSKSGLSSSSGLVAGSGVFSAATLFGEGPNRAEPFRARYRVVVRKLGRAVDLGRQANVAVSGGLRLLTGGLIGYHSLDPLGTNVRPEKIFSLRRTGMRVVRAMTAEHVLRFVSPLALQGAGLATVRRGLAEG